MQSTFNHPPPYILGSPRHRQQNMHSPWQIYCTVIHIFEAICTPPVHPLICQPESLDNCHAHPLPTMMPSCCIYNRAQSHHWCNGVAYKCNGVAYTTEHPRSPLHQPPLDTSHPLTRQPGGLDNCAEPAKGEASWRRNCHAHLPTTNDCQSGWWWA
jgi:hypothetical protein